ncbi:MAG: type II secretion system F family protein [Oliverpabstia sp.]
MIQGIGILILMFTAAMVIWGRKEGGSWKYRPITWMIRQGKKKGWYLPEWVSKEILFKAWSMLAAGSILVILMRGIRYLNEENITKLPRPEYGSGKQQEELEVEWKDEKGETRKENLVVDIDEKNLTQEEKEEIFHEVRERLSEIVLGDNASADYVNQKLVLPESLEEYPVEINWMTSDSESVDWDGNLGNNLPQDGKIICLSAAIRLQDEEQMYYQYVKVFPPLLDSQEQISSLVRKENENQESDWLKLPESWKDKKLIWRKTSNKIENGIAILVFINPLFLLLRERQILEEKRKQERQQMMRDYPEIVSKLTLLLSAGVNLRKAVERIGKDYINYNRVNGERKAYEIIVEICEEMERGVAESEAYERLGEKTGLLSYRTLSALLVQHLQKGSQGIELMLEEEAEKAQEMRQQQARILGEQASTKLLFPMVLMLLTVFVILLVPAWIFFSG